MTAPGQEGTSNKFQADDEISMEVVWKLVSWAWRKKYFLIAGFILGGGIGLVNALTTPKSYTATVRMLPAIDSSSSSFAGLASLGMGFGPSPTYEPVFEELIFSDSIVDGVLDREWVSRTGSKILMADLFSIFPESEDEIDRKKSKEKLKSVFRTSAISFKRDQFTGYMELKIKLPKDPVVAADVANHIVESLQEVLVQKHEWLADSRRSFLEARFVTVTDELVDAEEELAKFEKSNRNYSSSPRLVREHARLKRKVDVYLIVWTEIQKQIELVQISNQHGSPRVVVVDRATPPLFPSGPKRRLMVILGVIVGVFLAVGILLLVNLFSAFRSRILLGNP
jgi:uncharacterized protein involved in exopolysaccharide biosynthesis